MRRSSKVIAGVVLALLAGGVAWALFAPKASRTVDQEAVEGETVKRGAFHDGLPGHRVSGEIRIVRAAGGYVARLENYSATPGPDVYLYLTPEPDASTTAAVEDAGLQLRVPGGAMNGQATLRGNFNVPLPEGFDPARYQGVATWCKTYNAYFGGASLS